MEKASKVIFWNIWGHRHADELHSFLEEHSSDADVFCLTEVTDISDKELGRLGTVLCHSARTDEQASHVNGHQQLRERFAHLYDLIYQSGTRAKWTCEQTGTIFRGVGFGSALLVKKELLVLGTGNDKLHFSDEAVHSRVLQWVVYQKGTLRYLVAHFHGVWIQGNTKGDHLARTEQSYAVRQRLNFLTGFYNIDKVIFGGDFNLDIATEALRQLESGADGHGTKYRNLVKEFGINSTRTKSYRHFGLEGHSMFADYVLANEAAVVESFEVLTDATASDHAPLIVQFS